MLYWSTVTDALKEALIKLIEAHKTFGWPAGQYLVRRMSVDIDLFTGVPYGSIDSDALEQFLKSGFPYVQGNSAEMQVWEIFGYVDLQILISGFFK